MRESRGNAGIYMTRQFFEASSPEGYFFEKSKKIHGLVNVLNFMSISFFVWSRAHA